MKTVLMILLTFADIDVSELTNDHVTVPWISFTPCTNLSQLLQPLQTYSVQAGKSSLILLQLLI